MLRRISPFVLALTLAVLPLAAGAQGFVENVRQGVDRAGEPAGFEQNAGLIEIIGGVIRIGLSFVGVILLVLLLYAGFLWMTAGGDEEKIKAARGTITSAIVGIIIVTASYAIADFVLSRLTEVSVQGGGADTTPSR